MSDRAWWALFVAVSALYIAIVAAIPVAGQPAPTIAAQPPSTVPFCPAERPHRLEIETGTMNCSSQNCLGRIDCGSGTCRLTRDLGDHCNTCTMRTYVACLSETDLKAIRR